jgi:23S rRNA (guanosine2251-2'-O)-methyltransferase
MGAHRRVPWSHIADHREACEKVRDAGYGLIAIEVAEGAEHYQHFSYPEKTCLVLGNEGAGVYGTVMKQCDGAVFIPMAGKGRSVNVHVAGAVVAFEVMLRIKGSG